MMETTAGAPGNTSAVTMILTAKTSKRNAYKDVQLHVPPVGLQTLAVPAGTTLERVNLAATRATAISPISVG